MIGFKIGKYQIHDRNLNDRFDPLVDEVKEDCALPGGCQANRFGFNDALHDYGVDVFKFSDFSLAKTSEAARLMDEAAQRPFQADIAQLSGKAMTAGLDTGRYFDRLRKILRTTHRTAMADAESFSRTGKPGEVSIALAQAAMSAEKGRNK